MDVIEQQIIYTGGSLLCASMGSVTDIRERRIPNLITGPAIAAGLMLHFVYGGWGGLGDAALAGLIGGVLFLVFFLAGGMGAGDVKLMTAIGCITGLAPLLLIMVSTALAGSLFALLVSLHHGRLRSTLGNVATLLQHHGRHGLTPHPDLNQGNARMLRLPFALPIAAGCFITLCILLWETGP